MKRITVNILKRSVGTAIIMAIGFVAAATTMGSCVKESENACPATVSLQFIYLHNPDYTDYFSNEVNDLGLYLFDESNTLVYSRSIPTSSLGSGNSYNLRIAKGNYTVVVWGNVAGECYSLLNNGNCTDMMLNLVTRENNESDNTIENLFYGTATLSVNAMETASETVPMIRDTKNVYILLASANGQSLTGYAVGITGSNGAFYYDNSKASDQTINYVPAYRSVMYEESPYLQAHLKVMRLREGDDVTLSVLKGPKTIINESLTGLVLSNFPMITNDNDLDRYSDYTFVFTLDDNDTYVLTEIKVDDWVAKPGQSGGI